MPDLQRRALLAPILAALPAAGPNPVVLIDGPSGAGKSTLADALAAHWADANTPQLVRMDDIYPGWDGLDAAIEHLRRQVLLPWRAGLPAAWQRYDWAVNGPAEWHPLDPARPLVVEGCGTLAAAHEPLSDVRVWLSADDALRKRRALSRDGDAFRSHWDQWQQEWATYLQREAPEIRATVRLQATRD
ncbi:AAA family ATPase [Cryobacterium sp. PH31-L1]|uniref:AAA family ATPase n=1 Tax=Cryobacterium sp. PH31-L1 TaxID=3046199 RepID=UPI0024BB1CBB|nr:AAA family ATPase [Cryobacterium sp. PH31-L1]MDJ0378648.1 ATP-binding protein [Cryobacterium sp. PH31-L1]